MIKVMLGHCLEPEFLIKTCEKSDMVKDLCDDLAKDFETPSDQILLVRHAPTGFSEELCVYGRVLLFVCAFIGNEDVSWPSCLRWRFLEEQRRHGPLIRPKSTRQKSFQKTVAMITRAEARPTSSLPRSHSPAQTRKSKRQLSSVLICL